MSPTNTEIQEIGPTRKLITVKFTNQEVADYEQKLVKDFQKQAKIPGFRNGKAPENMVRTRFAKDIASELKSRVVASAHQQGVSGSDMNVYGVVDLDEGEIDSKKGATISFTVDIIPDFELPTYEGLEIKSATTDASEEEITTMLNQILGQRAEYNVVEKSAKKGDYVRCSYEGKIGDDLIAQLAPDASIFGTQASTWEEAGSTDSPGVSAVVEALVGLSAGDEKEVTFDFADDFEVKALSGKSATYSIKVEEVREKVLPELNDDFFKSIQVKDEAELRDQLSQNIVSQKKQQNFQAERQQITDQLNKAVDLALPQSGIEGETENILRDFMQRNIKQGAKSQDLDVQKEALHATASKAAEDRLKSRIILSKIAEKENIKVENDDFSRVIMNEAMQTGQKPEKLVKELRKDQDRINKMRSDILLSKAMDLLIEKSIQANKDSDSAN
ncbi:MAG: trigger factor [Verrucomicrobiota bacterium]|nr:trigger factor [Verrucomicrobiota bacterium]